MQVMVNGLLTAYQTSGQGRVVLLVHGWGSRASDLKIIQTELAKNFQVIAPDLPGFGESEAPKEAWGLNEYAKHTRDLLQKLDVGTVHALIGHSNGGAIAIRGLASGTLQANRLILLASSGIRGEYQGRNLVLRSIARVGKALTSPLPARAKRALRRKVYDTIGSDMLVAEHLQESFKKIVSDDVRDDAAKLSLPTLLIYGEQDRATPVRYGELFHERIDGSMLEVLPEAGHFVFNDRPKETLRAIEEFLR